MNGIKKVARTKTWTIFKSHFKDAQAELKDIRGPTIQQAGYHHAKMLATKLREDLQLQGADILALVQEIANADNNPPIDDAQPPSQSTANAAVQDTVKLEIIRLLSKIAQDQHTCRGSQGGVGSQGG